MNCLNNKSKTRHIFGIILFKSIMNVLKSAMFNLFLLTLGFCLGYYALGLKVHYYATAHDEYQYIEQLEKHINDLNNLDDAYDREQQELRDVLKNVKYKLAHDVHHECESKLGSKLYK